MRSRRQRTCPICCMICGLMKYRKGQQRSVKRTRREIREGSSVVFVLASSGSRSLATEIKLTRKSRAARLPEGKKFQLWLLAVKAQPRNWQLDPFDPCLSGMEHSGCSRLGLDTLRKVKFLQISDSYITSTCLLASSLSSLLLF